MCGECAAVSVCEQIARKKCDEIGFKNVPASARQTPPIYPENYIFRFLQHKKWVIQNSCPIVGRSFFGKKGQHFLDSIISGLYKGGCYGNKILYKNLDLAQEFPNKDFVSLFMGKNVA